MALLGEADLRGADAAGLGLDGADIVNADFRDVIGVKKSVGLDRAEYRNRAFFSEPPIRMLAA